MFLLTTTPAFGGAISASEIGFYSFLNILISLFSYHYVLYYFVFSYMYIYIYINFKSIIYINMYNYHVNAMLCNAMLC
jgi:hypothetical protein